ncbi:MAG: DoxX family protein [Chitinophagaceae bacterium]
MKKVLWILQVILAAMFLMAGSFKTFTPIAELAEKMPWVTEYSEGMVRFVGVSELLGGLGIILPSLLRIKPILTTVAGFALGLVMILAAAYHISKGEFSSLPMNFILGGIAVYVAWARWRKYPVEAR